AGEPVLREAPLQGDFERVVLPLRLRSGEVSRRRWIRSGSNRVLSLAGVADNVDAVTVDQGAHVLNRSTEVVMDVVHTQRRRPAQLVVDATVEAVLIHRLDIRIRVQNRRGAQIPEPSWAAPEVV